jgi:methionyl aminopeptidase
MGIEYKKLYTDHAITIPVGNIDDKTKKLLKVTEQSLYKGIDVMKPGVSLYEVGKAIQNFVESNGFSVVRELIGHGVGHSVHEAPEIPNFYDPRMFRDVKLKTGMVLAVEPMVNVGDWPISTLEDGWTVVTTDGSLSAHFEHTVAITSNGVEILTQV